MAGEKNKLYELRVLSIRNMLLCTVFVGYPGQPPAHCSTHSVFGRHTLQCKTRNTWLLKVLECHPLIGLCKFFMICALFFIFLSLLAVKQKIMQLQRDAWRPPNPTCCSQAAADSSGPCSVKFCPLPRTGSL